MGNLKRKAIHCPKTYEHPPSYNAKKILLLLAGDEINIQCKEHGWFRIKLYSNGELITFDNPSAVITEVKKGTNFDWDPVPVIADGVFASKRRHRKCQPL